MKRTRRPTNPVSKPFVSGGIYNPNASSKPLIQLPGLQDAADVSARESMPTPDSLNHTVSAMQEPLPKKMLDAASLAAALPKPIIVKEEPTEPEAEGEGEPEADSDRDMMIDLSEEGNGGKIPFKKIFQKRKKSSERTRDKKQRQNRQLRKSMLPKNALMALNEVKGVTISDFTIDSNSDGGFTAIVTVNSNQYEGKGLSKMSAKNAACEKAWRDFIIARMTPKPPRLSSINGAVVQLDNQDDEMDSTDSPEDDLPMLNLASFAIYKLFAEWEREGYAVPEMHPSSSAQANAAPGGDMAPATPSAPKEPKKPPIRSELPPNWETMHPATILCIMRPGITYVDYGTSGEKPNVVQHLGIVVDNQEFTASGRSKKIARRNVAVTVCNTLFGTNFEFENVA